MNSLPGVVRGGEDGRFRDAAFVSQPCGVPPPVPGVRGAGGQEHGAVDGNLGTGGSPGHGRCAVTLRLRASLCPRDYVRQTEDRLCEPHFQRSTALSGVRVDVQDYLGAGIVPTPQPRLKLTLNTLRANPTPFLELSL